MVRGRLAKAEALMLSSVASDVGTDGGATETVLVEERAKIHANSGTSGGRDGRAIDFQKHTSRHHRRWYAEAVERERLWSIKRASVRAPRTGPSVNAAKAIPVQFQALAGRRMISIPMAMTLWRVSSASPSLRPL